MTHATKNIWCVQIELYCGNYNDDEDDDILLLFSRSLNEFICLSKIWENMIIISYRIACFFLSFLEESHLRDRNERKLKNLMNFHVQSKMLKVLDLSL